MDTTRGPGPSPGHRALIERKLAEYPVVGASGGARRACLEVGALPLHQDWDACMAIRPDGVVVWVDHDEPHGVRVVEDERERNIGLHRASLADPDLRCLVPPRPPEAVDCPDCRGTGSLSFPEGFESLAGRVLCSCGGIGWLPDPGGRRR